MKLCRYWLPDSGPTLGLVDGSLVYNLADADPETFGSFSRMLGNREGQVFALIVMVVAACEVVVGLGLIVAMYRQRLPIDVDEVRELRG